MNTYGYELYFINKYGEWMRADKGSLFEMVQQGKKAGIGWKVMLGEQVVDTGGPGHRIEDTVRFFSRPSKAKKKSRKNPSGKTITMYSLYSKKTRRNPSKPAKKTSSKRKYVPMDVTPMPASKKLRAKRRVNRIVPSPSTPETRARAKERAAKSKVIGKLFSAGNAKMAMKLARGQITIAQGRNAL